MPEEIAGAIERITYYNEENGYSVVKIMPEKRYPRAQARDGTVTVVGSLPQLNEGEEAQFVGEWVVDARYGRQFRAEQAIPIAPTSAKGIINYLSSGIVKGIGPRTAQKIVDHLGAETISILDNEPERIHEVPGLKPRLADNLIKVWTKTASCATSSSICRASASAPGSPSASGTNIRKIRSASLRTIPISWRRMSS